MAVEKEIDKYETVIGLMIGKSIHSKINIKL